MVIGATNDSSAVTAGYLSLGNKLADNWKSLNAKADILRIFLNSLKVTLSTVVLSILICSLAAYGFEKYRSRPKEIVYNIFLLSMMIPFAAQMIPLFNMMYSFNLMDTHIAVILPYLAMPFLIFFFRQNFKSFPTELIEAARIDGAGEVRIFFQLVVPPMKSTFAAGAIYAFMKQWNNYLCHL
jgi:lactose/L-arabinose transport system permease protein